jgi:hypothetical protein
MAKLYSQRNPSQEQFALIKFQSTKTKLDQFNIYLTKAAMRAKLKQ